MSLRPFVIQCLDHEEGCGARWFDLPGSRHETREQAREHLKRIRATDEEDNMYSYRIVEVNSAAYYAQPTDALEY
jgi:hypothetical protein